MKMLDLFCGRFGWSKAFAARGWECTGIDLTRPSEIPENCAFVQADVMDVGAEVLREFDFICASSPCEQFSVWGMSHFHRNPAYPETGLKLFNHTKQICEASGRPYVMENVRPAQRFVGNAKHHCGPYYLWGNAVPPLMPQGVRKGVVVGSSKLVNGMTSLEERRIYRRQNGNPAWAAWSHSKARKDATAAWAAIPRELASCVADYAERILETAA